MTKRPVGRPPKKESVLDHKIKLTEPVIEKLKKESVADDFIANVVSSMEKQFGKGSALVPDANTILCKIEHWVSTRSFLIDYAISGDLPSPRPIIPFGRLTEISGSPGVGKTSLLSQIMAETQAIGGIAVILDTEQALDLSYLEKLGVNLKKLIVVQADTIEDVFTRIEALVKVIKERNASQLVCIGWDSLGGTPTRAQAEAEAGDHFYAEAAKVVGKNLQRIIQMIAKEKIALIINNHLYRKMDIKYGDPWETYGGEKVKFLSTLRIRLQKMGQITEKGEDEEGQIIGHKIKVKIIKNKMAPILKQIEVPCIGGLGFSKDYAVMDYAIKTKLITSSGSWKKLKTYNGIEITFQNWKDFQEKVINHAEYLQFSEQVISQYIK